MDAARCLLASGAAAEVLGVLADVAEAFAGEKHDAVLPLFACCIAARVPLAEAEWALVPDPCPGLGAALPAVLQLSTVQAACLVAHLLAEDVQHLRCAALCLARAQCAHDAPLPQPLVWRVLSLCLPP